MIQSTSCTSPTLNTKNTKSIVQNTGQEVAKSKGKSNPLNVYLEHLSEAPPTYSSDIKHLMRNASIEENNLNIEIVKTLDKQGVEVSRRNLDIIVTQLQKEHIVNMYKQGYDIETLTIDIIAKEVQRNEHLSDINENMPPALDEYKEKLEEIKDIKDSTIQNMASNDLEITVNNLYKSRHSGEFKSIKETVTEEQIISVLLANGIEVTQENMNAAKRLIRGNIEVGKDRIEKCVAIENILKNLDIDQLMLEAVKVIKQGKNPGDIKLQEDTANLPSPLTYNNIEQIIEDVQKLDDKVIEEAYRQDKHMNIGNLQQILHENIEKVLGSEKLKNRGEPEEGEKISITKRQIEEIRLKLTVEAALKLNNKIDIQTAPLHQVVEELKVLEDEQYVEVLNNVGTPVTEENIEHLKNVANSLDNIYSNKEIPIAKVVSKEIDFTIKEMDDAIKVRLAEQSYEDIGTKPEGRFGETVKKVEDQLEHILETHNIEPTNQNIKAAKALVQNNVDITEQKVEEAKSVLLKIETIFYELRPAVVAQMLRDGIRPDTTHIDQLMDYVSKMQMKNGHDHMQKVAEAILELDKTSQITHQEKEGLIAVYRMLNIITKNETAAIGILLKNNKDLTLGNLFEASKYIKQIGNKTGKMDVSIDDTVGALESKSPDHIRSLIANAAQLPAKASELGKWNNHKDILEQWLLRITPDELKEYINVDQLLEDIHLTEGKPSLIEIERITKQLKGLEEISPHTLAFLKDKNVPFTISNIYWVDKMIKDPFLLGDIINEYETITGEKIKSSINNAETHQLQETIDQLQEELTEQIPIQLSISQNTMAYALGRELEQMLSIQKEIANHDGIYQVPVELHHGMSNLNIYVMKDKEHGTHEGKEELRGYMSIKTKNLGIIQVYMRILDHSISFEMIGETTDITSKLQQDSNELKKAIEGIGYNVLQTKFIQKKFTNPMTVKPKESTPLLRRKFVESKFEHII